MKRVTVYAVCLMLTHTTAMMSMDEPKVRPIIIPEPSTPPSTPKTPKTPLPRTPRECACAILARTQTSKPFYDDADHPVKSPKSPPAPTLAPQSDTNSQN